MAISHTFTRVKVIEAFYYPVKNFGHSNSYTTLQSKMNAKLSPQRFWAYHENGLIKTIQPIPHNLYVSFKLTSLYCGLRIILVYPNPQ